MNACDAGREGELIFAYIYSTSKVKKPVQRLWLNSMTKKAIVDAFGTSAPGRGDGVARGGRPLTLRGGLGRRHERDPRGHRSGCAPPSTAPCRWVACRRRPSRSSPGARRRSARSSPSRTGSSRPTSPPTTSACTRAATSAASASRRSWRRRSSRTAATSAARSPSSRRRRSASARSCSTTSPRSSATPTRGTASRPSARSPRRRSSTSSTRRITYPRTNSRWLSGDMVPEIRPTAEFVGHNGEYAKGAAYVTSLKELPLGRVVNDKKVEDHHAIIPTKSEHDLSKMREDEKKIYDLVAQALPRDLPSRGGVRAHAHRDHRRRARVPHERARAARGRLALGVRPGARLPRQARGRLRRRPAAAQARAGRGRRARSGRVAAQGDSAPAGASPRRRCSARWRRRARTSRTSSCARR